jgi:hypothetical protein
VSGEYEFEEERGGLDFDYRDEFEPTEAMINDWNIHNDHQGDNEELTDDELDAFEPIWCRDCGADISRFPHFSTCGDDLDIF